MLNWDPKQKLYFTAGLFFLAVGLFLFFAALPILTSIKINGAELAQKKQAMATFYQDWQSLENSKKEFDAINEKLLSQDALLPKEEAIKFIMFVERAARETNNQQEISVVAPKKAEGEESQKDENINFQINLVGDFPALMKFLAYLENAPFYNDLASIQIQRISEKPTESQRFNIGDIKTVINLAVYQQ